MNYYEYFKKTNFKNLQSLLEKQQEKLLKVGLFRLCNTEDAVLFSDLLHLLSD